jgi:tetratricopeptide (TPR) repeat protein
MQQPAAELEQRAERAVRRGELLSAIEHFEAYLAQHPEDERIRQRMESVRALLQPSELVSRRRTEPEEPESPSAESLSDAELGEMHASSGRFADALRSYERAVARSPGNELLLERLEELRTMTSPGARADLNGAEKLDDETAVRGHPPATARSAKANDALFSPMKASLLKAAQAATPAERKDNVVLLRELLDRVRLGRRSGA